MLRPWSRSKWYRIESMGLRGLTRSDGPCEPATNRVNPRAGRPARTRFGVGRRKLDKYDFGFAICDFRLERRFASSPQSEIANPKSKIESLAAIGLSLLQAQADRGQAHAERLFIDRLTVQLARRGGNGAIAA